jgi:hypothetical protein
MPNTIGMSVPGASSLYGSPSVADQVAGKTEEERKKGSRNCRLRGNSRSVAVRLRLDMAPHSGPNRWP